MDTHASPTAFPSWMTANGAAWERELMAYLETGDPNARVSVPIKASLVDKACVATLPLLWAIVARFAQDNRMPSWDKEEMENFVLHERAQRCLKKVRQCGGQWVDQPLERLLLDTAEHAALPVWWNATLTLGVDALPTVLVNADKHDSLRNGHQRLLSIAGWVEWISGGGSGTHLSLGLAMLNEADVVEDYLDSTNEIAGRLHPLLPLLQCRELLRGFVRLSPSDVWVVPFERLHAALGPDIAHLQLGAGEGTVVFKELKNHPLGVAKAQELGFAYDVRDVWECWNLVKCMAQQEKYGNGRAQWEAALAVLNNHVAQFSFDNGLPLDLHFTLKAVLSVANTAGAVEVIDLLADTIGLDTPVVDEDGNVLEIFPTVRQTLEREDLTNLQAYVQRKTLVQHVETAHRPTSLRRL